MKFKAATLFSGGGGADLGLIEAGFTPVWGVEKDEAIANCFKSNFPTVEMAIRDIRSLNPGNYKSIDLLHCSPPCQQYSAARKEKYKHPEADVGFAVVTFLTKLKPRFFTLENVPAYVNSNPFQAIYSFLELLGYNIQSEVINACDYGVPQFRKRLILRASKSSIKPLIPQEKIGWYKAIADLIPGLPETKLAAWQRPHIDKVKHRPLLIARAGTNVKNCLPRQAHQPAPTVRALKNWGGSHWADIVLKKSVHRITPEATARLMSFPDSYKLPSSVSLSQQILGNAVPPKMMAAIASSFI